MIDPSPRSLFSLFFTNKLTTQEKKIHSQTHRLRRSQWEPPPLPNSASMTIAFSHQPQSQTQRPRPRPRATHLSPTHRSLPVPYPGPSTVNHHPIALYTVPNCESAPSPPVKPRATVVTLRFTSSCRLVPMSHHCRVPTMCPLILLSHCYFNFQTTCILLPTDSFILVNQNFLDFILFFKFLSLKTATATTKINSVP